MGNFSTSKKFYTDGYNIWKSDFNKNPIYNQGFRIDSEFYMEEDNRKFKSRRNTIVPRKEVSWNNKKCKSFTKTTRSTKYYGKRHKVFFIILQHFQ